MSMAHARGTKGVRVKQQHGLRRFFKIHISRAFVIFSGVIGAAFSAYVFGVCFRCIFWGGFGDRFGVRRIFLTYFLNFHNMNGSSSSTVNATFDAIALKYFHTSSLILHT